MILKAFLIQFESIIENKSTDVEKIIIIGNGIKNAFIIHLAIYNKIKFRFVLAILNQARLIYIVEWNTANSIIHIHFI
jgi:hypothetical protein